MKNLIISILLLTVQALASQNKKILIVASNVATVNGKINGTYLMEIAAPFDYFIKQGFEVDVLSPLGGAAAIYHKGDTTARLKEMALNSGFQKAVANTRSPKQVNAGDYGAILFPGGYGHFWDVFGHKEICAIAAAIYEAGGVVGALGHGTADLAGITLSTGNYLVKGKSLTCFPTWVEKEFMTEADYGRLLPFDMEKELAARGAMLKDMSKEGSKSGSNIRAVDAENRIVTAAFADGGEFVAKEMHLLLLKH